MNADTLTIASLFSGIGALDLAVRLVLPGSRTAFLCEREASAAAILVQRMEEGTLDPAPIYPDVCSLYARRLRGLIDIVIGGFPCTSASVAGKRTGFEGESGLWHEMCRIIGECEPAIVFIENVPGLNSVKTGTSSFRDPDGLPMDDDPDELVRGTGTVLRDLASLGFDAEWDLLSAIDLGDSQLRKRLFILAWHPGRMADSTSTRPEWPKGRRELSKRSRSQASRPVNGDGEVEDARRASIGRTSQSPELRRPRTSDDDRGTGGALADASDGQLSQPGRGTPERAGIGSAGENVEESASARLSLRRESADQSGDVRNASGTAERPGAGVWPYWPPGPGDANQWAAIIERWPHLAPAVADAGPEHGPRQPGVSHNKGSESGRRSHDGESDVGQSTNKRARKLHPGQRQSRRGTAKPDRASGTISIDEQSTQEVKSDVRGVAPRCADRLDESDLSRAHRLRALGGTVVISCASVAFSILAQRAGIGTIDDDGGFRLI